MSINLIVATDQKYGIGRENALPWPRNKRDMEWFRQATMGHVVVMGRRTWESIGSKPLPGRINGVISSKPVDGAHGSYGGDLDKILPMIQDRYPDLHIFVIGGADIYKQSISVADKLFLTTFPRTYDCDTYIERDLIVKFPLIKYWEEDAELTFQIRTKNGAVSRGAGTRT